MRPDNWPNGSYKVILADPPWNYKNFSQKGENRNANQHYSCMALQDIKNLPVKEIAAKDCHLFLWSTWPHIESALDTIKAWGFKYSSIGFTWVKRNKNAPGLIYSSQDFFVGMGYTTRKNTEICLLARKGSPTRLRKDIQELVISPIREHSRKPDEVIQRIEQYSDGPYCELFSRSRRTGWDSFGNEVDKF